MARSLVTMLFMLALLPAVGCTNGSAKVSRDDGAKLLASFDQSTSLDSRIVWQTDVGLEPGRQIDSFTLLGDTIAVLDDAKVLTLIDDTTGNVRWRKVIGKQLDRFSKPTIYSDHLIICSETTLFAMRMDNGELVDSFALQHNAATDPQIIHGLLIYGTPDGLMVGQTMQGGYVIWRYKFSSAIATNPIGEPGTMFVADERGQVGTLNPRTGQIVWRRGNPPWGKVTAQSDAANGIAYVASEDQKLYAFDRASGSIVWQFLTEFPLTQSPKVIGERVYQHTREMGLVALDSLTGEKIWNAQLVGQPVQRRGDALLLLDGTTIHRIDRENAKPIDTIDLTKADRVIFDAPENGNLYLVNDAGPVLKLAPR